MTFLSPHSIGRASDQHWNPVVAVPLSIFRKFLSKRFMLILNSNFDMGMVLENYAPNTLTYSQTMLHHTQFLRKSVHVRTVCGVAWFGVVYVVIHIYSLTASVAQW